MLRQTWSRYRSSLSIGVLQNLIHGAAQLAPRLHLFRQRSSPLFRDVVVPPLATGLLFFPFADNQPALFHFVQAGIQRAFAPGEGAVGVAMDGGGDLVAVHRLAA